MNRAAKIILGIAVLVVLSCLGGAIYSSVTSDPKAPQATKIEHGGPPVKAVPKTSASQRPDTIREGTWEVGVDVKPGKYRTGGALEASIPMCYWDVRDGAPTGDFVDQGVTKVGESGIVVLKKGQYFKTSGCEAWYAAK
jgi:hypothetical protein